MRELPYKDPKKSDPIAIGHRIRAAREKLQMTQAQLADRVGTSQQTIEKIELGKVQRSSFIYPIYDVLGLRGAPLHNYDPAPKSDEFDFRGSTFKVRREFLGLEITELAALTHLDASEIHAAEQNKGPVVPDDLDRAIEIDRILSRLESEEPLGEPAAPHTYYLSALPSPAARTALFAMNTERGLTFKGYIPSPMSIPRMALGSSFCIETAAWATGLAAGGDRIYCRVDVNMWRWRSPLMVLATKVGQLHSDIDEILVGEVVEGTSAYTTISLGPGTDVLKLDPLIWNVAIVLDAVWSNESFKRIRSP